MLNKFLKTSYILVLAIVLAACSGTSGSGGKTPEKGNYPWDDYTEVDHELIAQGGSFFECMIISDDGTERLVGAEYGITTGDYPWAKNAQTVTLKPKTGSFSAFKPLGTYADASNGKYLFDFVLNNSGIDITKPVNYHLFINDKYIGSGYDPKYNTVAYFAIDTVDQTTYDAFMALKPTDTFSFILDFPLQDGTINKFTSPKFSLQ